LIESVLEARNMGSRTRGINKQIKTGMVENKMHKHMLVRVELFGAALGILALIPFILRVCMLYVFEEPVDMRNRMSAIQVWA
jgi:hypothetical protein